MPDIENGLDNLGVAAPTFIRPEWSENEVSPTRAPIITRIIEIVKTVYESETVSYEIRFLNTLTLSCERSLPKILNITIANVVVRIPPAVEAGADPMNIIIE